MGQDPEAIREEIEQTREEMGDTVQALGHKADVKGRAKDAISERTGELKSKIAGASGTVSDATPDGQQVEQAVGVAQENPLGLAVGGIAAGFLLGMAIPSTRIEDEKMGETADQLKDAAKQTGQEALERGKTVAQETAQAAGETTKETVQESAQQQGEELKESAQANAPASTPAR